MTSGSLLRYTVFLGNAIAMLSWLLVAGAANAQPQASPGGLRIGGPSFDPGALAPSESTSIVTVTATVAGDGMRPTALLLEEVRENGRPQGIVAELADNGENGDRVARDGRYSATLELGSETESDRRFRLRITGSDIGSAAPPTVFAVTDLPLGFPGFDPADAVPTEPGYSDIIANTVAIAAARGVGPIRISAVLEQVGNELGTTIEVSGYSPALNGYVARFSGARTLDAVLRVASALDSRPEIDSATPSYLGLPAAPIGQWWLANTNVDALRNQAPSPSGSPFGSLPARGSVDTEVAVIEASVGAGFTCLTGTGLESKCLMLPPTLDCNYGTANNQHAIKVGTLIAGSEPPAPAYDGIEGGVAPEIRMLSLSAQTLSQVGQALSCSVTHGMKIANMSLEFAILGTHEANLRAGVCNAVCGNVLMVSASGDRACPGDMPLPYPGAFAADPTETCSCASGTENIRDFMLSVGGTAEDDTLGDTCSTNNMRSKPGDIYAPGWQIPGTDASPTFGPEDFGTSWSAPLVTGCAAVIAAVETWGGGPSAWDAKAVEALLRTSGASGDATHPGPRLDCLAAVYRPYDVDFLLDASGSMNAPAAGTAGPTRWAVLSNAATEFAILMDGTAPTGSRMGVTLFSTAFPGNTSDPLGGLQPLPSVVAGSLGPALALTPSGGTPMGPGLEAAVAKLSSPGRPRILILFTDGIQNVPRYVYSDGCNFSDVRPGDGPLTNPALITNPCPGTESDAIKILPVGVGSPSSLYHTTLQALAASHRTHLLIVDNLSSFSGFMSAPCALSIAAAFECGVAPALYGSSLQMVESATAPLLPASELLRFELDAGPTRLAIKLRTTHAGVSFGRLGADVRIRKDGSDVTAYFRRSPGPDGSSLFLTTDFLPSEGQPLAALAPVGTYTVDLLSNPDNDALLTQLGASVTALAFADEHRLDMTWQLTPEMPRVGQSLQPEVTLHWAGAPVTDAEVVARIGRPGADLGNALAENRTIVDPLPGPDAASPGWQKYDQLWRNDSEFRSLLAPREEILPLVHVGDGRYTASFDADNVSGVYQIAYEVLAEVPGAGIIQREAGKSVYVRFGEIDMDRSIVSRAVEGNSISVVFKPVASNGFIGPGNGSSFSVIGSEVRLLDVIDHQDGSYTFTLEGDPRSRVELQVLGETIYSGRADFSSRRRWWLVLLSLIAIAMGAD